ncbi:MAG TPA: IS4 family transposase [Vicinamibacterales bacterium]|nr:IS4 family transposase [Vicinamibacterales bacterium]
MIATWVQEELQTVDLHDQRLNERLMDVLDQLAGHPTASIPAASGGHAEMTAAYRFFSNSRVSFEQVLAPHREATLRRCGAQATVIAVQDTTEIDLTRPATRVEGDGPLDHGARRGLLLHEIQTFTADGTPLGTLAATCWARDEEPLGHSAAAHAARHATPIEDKESQRWVEGLRVVRVAARQLPATRLICVADSEADIYELLAEATAEPQAYDWIVRGCQDRALAHEADENSGLIQARLREQPVLYETTITVRARQSLVSQPKARRKASRTGREATVEVRAAPVTLRPPRRRDRRLPVVTLNVVLVLERDQPPGEEPIEWLLLTDLPIDRVADVQRVVQLYGVRWMIEVFFRTLKSGCRVEERRFEKVERLLPCLAVYLITAWRTLFVCRLGRSCPDANCEVVFEPAEWRAVYTVIHRTTPPHTPPKLADMVRLVAQLGGYVNRPRPDPPGPQTVWLGLQRTHDLALAWQTFGPGQPRAP